MDFIWLLIFIVFFICIWLVLTYFFYVSGWAYLSIKYKNTDDLQLNNAGKASLYINNISYNNNVVFQFNEKGASLKPIWYLKIFHPTVFVPWKDIQENTTNKLLLANHHELVIGKPYVADLRISNKQFLKFADHLNDE